MTVATIPQGSVRTPISALVSGKVQQTMIERKNRVMTEAAKSAGSEELMWHELFYDVSFPSKLRTMAELNAAYLGKEILNGRNLLAKLNPGSNEYIELRDDMVQHPVECVAELKKFIELELKSDLWKDEKNYESLKPHLNVALDLIGKIHGVDSYGVAKDLVEALKALNKDALSTHLILAHGLMEKKGTEVGEWAEKMALMTIRIE